MLFTSSLSDVKKSEKMKTYYLINGRGNDVVIPDQSDLEQLKCGTLTLQGFKLNYLAKLMRPEAEKWMNMVANDVVNQDVILVSDEENQKNCFRIMLAEMILSMFSGHMKVRYKGEL